MIDFSYLAKFICVYIRVLRRFSMEDRKHSHNVLVYSKFAPLFRGA